MSLSCAALPIVTKPTSAQHLSEEALGGAGPEAVLMLVPALSSHALGHCFMSLMGPLPFGSQV